MRRLLVISCGLIAIPVLAVGSLFVLPRPADTTQARVLEDGTNLDYCKLPTLSSTGPRADDIPVAYTPGCGWQTFPKPVLAECTEPLASGAPDLRGLWEAYEGRVGHVERIEQCGDRVVVTSSGIIHDMRTDFTLRNGANDVGPSCMRIRAAARYRNGVLEMDPFGLRILPAVTRHLEGDELVWYHLIAGESRMRRICHLPGSRPVPETRQARLP